MSTERWTPLNYTNDSKIPLVGEVILLRYPTSTIYFPHGPASAAPASSHAYTGFSSTATGNLKDIRSIMHYILILDVSHDKKNHKIKVVLSPIMSYSSPPFYLPLGSPWDAEQWMTNQATDSQRLHHLPVPASGWVPPASICSDAPILSFGGWMNTRRSWLGMVHVRYEILEIHKWCRHPNGPVIIDGGVANLYYFLLVGIPRKLNDIRAASVAPVVNAAMLPNYDTVWTDLYSQYHPAMPWCNSHTDDGPIDDYDASVTGSEIDRAMQGDDGIDPISFWNFRGAPKELFDLASEQERHILDDRILNWESRCSSDGTDWEVDHGVVESGLDVKEISFGEDAFQED